MFHYYLEETGVDSALLPALNFMRIDANDEPDVPRTRGEILAEALKQARVAPAQPETGTPFRWTIAPFEWLFDEKLKDPESRAGKTNVGFHVGLGR